MKLHGTVKKKEKEICAGFVVTLQTTKVSVIQVVVDHTCNPSYSGGRSGGSQFQASPGK
jgi:hypothetical protein